MFISLQSWGILSHIFELSNTNLFNRASGPRLCRPHCLLLDIWCLGGSSVPCHERSRPWLRSYRRPDAAGVDARLEVLPATR
jgi:hypothetical protein